MDEKLSQLLGRQSVEVPASVILQLTMAMEAAGQDMTTLDGLGVRAYMKTLKMGKHYEQAHAVANKLTKNKAIVRLDHQLEDDLRHWFLKIQRPFDKHKGSKRKSFLNYNYVLYQLLTLVRGYDISHLRSQLTMLKSKARLKEHDLIWERICEEVGLPFNPYHGAESAKRVASTKRPAAAKKLGVRH